ncbi:MULTISPECIES: hypothetical protein [unclassified Microbacterium]|uniref:hypothetical protein n=1 Tax=Microbacterium TaxID=33882 RepID=UPI003BA2381C
MARGLGDRAGGILGLLDLVDEHQEAIEYELIAAGLRLRDLSTPALTWRDLFVLVRRWQKTPGNALAAGVYGAEVPSWTEQVLATIVDLLQAVAWKLPRPRRSGGKPKRFARWWEKRTQAFGRDPIPASQFDDWWESKSPGRGSRG